MRRSEGQADQSRAGAAATVAEAIRDTTAALHAAGIEDAGMEARRIIAAATGLQAIDLITRSGARVDPDAAERLSFLLAGRCGRVPLSRLLGEREFYGRLFSLSRATLDPRPDTEALVEALLQLARETGWTGRRCNILDAGTGSGAILVTALAEMPLATGIGVDIAAEAVATATKNAHRHGVGDRARFIVGDMRDLMQLPDPIDIVVSNPPYIPTAEIEGLPPEVRLHDPHAALDGGADGLAFYREFAPLLERISADGMLLVEVGAGQADAVSRLFERAAPSRRLRRFEDLGGHTRVVATLPHVPSCRE